MAVFKPCSHVCILTLTVMSVINVTRTVIISPQYQEVMVCDVQIYVTLPCIYTTSSNESAQVEWYLRRSDRRENVMSVSSRGTITEGDNFLGRVKKAKGHNASMILNDPKYNDSGMYSCEVVSTKDTPCCDKGLVKLVVKRGSCENMDSTSSECKPDIALPVVVCTLDLLTIVALIVVVVLSRPRWRNVCTEYRKQGIVVLTAVVCCLLGAVLLIVNAVNSFSGSPTLPGMLFSIAGITLSCVCTILTPICKLPRGWIADKQPIEPTRSEMQSLTDEEKMTSQQESAVELIGKEIIEHNGPPQEVSTGQQSHASEEDIARRSHRHRSIYQRVAKEWFVRTTPIEEAKRTLETENSLMLIGGPGEGKSFILLGLAANTECLPITCTKPGEVETCILQNKQNPDQTFLFVCDDPFGISCVQRELVRDWVDMIEKLQALIMSHKFVFAVRRTVWLDCADLRNNPLFKNTMEVKSASLTALDKRALVNNYMRGRGKLTEDQMKAVVESKNPIAYVTCCKLMNDASQRGESGVELVKVFRRPYPFLSHELQKMVHEEEIMYDTLCLIMLCGGEMRCQEDSGPSSDIKERMDACGCRNRKWVDILKSADKLTGTYLRHIHERCVYQFVHDSVQEAVTMEYGKRHFQLCWQFLDRDVIAEMVRPRDYKKSEHEFAVSVPEKSYKDVAAMFTQKVIDGKDGLESVFRNPCVTDQKFQDVWYEYLRSSRNKLEAFEKCRTGQGQCLFCHLANSGASKLLYYLQRKKSCKCKK